MKAPTAKSFLFNTEQIADACTTWANFNGFSGENCGSCGNTANILAGGPGWICTCGHFNLQSWHHHQMPHDAPTLGPRREIIRNGIRRARANVG